MKGFPTMVLGHGCELPIREIFDAVKVLEANNVPPYECACGQSYYVKAPPGWCPGDKIRFECDCGRKHELGGMHL